MIYSMTGFARSQHEDDWGSIVWELKSVNHRYLDISLYLPESLRSLENKIREQLRTHLGRGKVDARLKFTTGPKLGSQIAVNQELLQQLASLSNGIGKHFETGANVNPIDILRWPGIIQEDTNQLEPIYDKVLQQLEQAAQQLKTTRAQEGSAIKTMLTDRLDGIEQHVMSVRAAQPEMKANYRTNLLAKLTEVTDKLDSDRLEQEMVHFAQRTDVDEELDRLNAHVVEIRKVLDSGAQIGRRLDFFMQELNREANTLSSKSQSHFQTHSAVEMKVLIEQMREQVQNVE